MPRKPSRFDYPPHRHPWRNLGCLADRPARPSLAGRSLKRGMPRKPSHFD
jgi:hypothetical protein